MLIQRMKNKFWRDVSGVSAVEFALILPVMLTMIFGTIEISNLMIADRKLVSATSTTADLFAQTKTVTTAEIADIFLAGRAVMQPLADGTLTFVVSSVVADGAGVTKVEWSEGYGAASHGPGSGYTLPAGIVGPNQSVIVVESGYSYVSLLGQLIISPITLTDRFFLSPRRSVKVTRL